MCGGIRYCDSYTGLGALVVFIGWSVTAAFALGECLGKSLLTSNHWWTWSLTWLVTYGCIYIGFEVYYIAYQSASKRGDERLQNAHFNVYTRMARYLMWTSALWFVTHALYTHMNDADQINAINDGLAYQTTNASVALVHWIFMNAIPVLSWPIIVAYMSDISYREAEPMWHKRSSKSSEDGL